MTTFEAAATIDIPTPSSKHLDAEGRRYVNRQMAGDLKELAKQGHDAALWALEMIAVLRGLAANARFKEAPDDGE